MQPEVEMEVEGRQEKSAGRWVKMPVTPPGEMAEGRRDCRIESSGQRQDLGLVVSAAPAATRTDKTPGVECRPTREAPRT